MSYVLTALAWEIVFPTHLQKLVALRLCSYANDDGDSIFPASDTLAHQVDAKKRGVQYVLAGFRNCGLIEQVHDGGKGSGDTNRYRLNVELLIKLAYREQCLKGAKECLELVDNKGAPCAPSTLRRVHEAAIRVHRGAQKDAPGCTQVVTRDQLENQYAQARALPEGAALAALGENTITVKRTDTGAALGAFGAWLKWLVERQQLDLAQQATAEGELLTDSVWPKDDSGLPQVPDKAPITDRIVGEGAA